MIHVAIRRARRALRAAAPRVVAVLVAAGLLGMLGGTAVQAHANGVPTDVQLSYIGLSNWGPKDATGTAELMFSEGLVKITATGLTQLSGQRYQGWLVDSQTGDAISFGRFNADTLGNVSYEGKLPPLSNFGFDLLILTVEPDPDNAPQPTEKRSIGGYFSLIGQTTPDGTKGAQTAPGSSSSSGSMQSPGQLPNTGDATLVTDLERVGVLLGIMGLSVFVGLRLGRRSA